MIEFSLIIPVYNSRKYLKRLFDSILEQDFDNYEVVVVNDGSTDTTGNVIDEYSKRFHNFKVINISNSGPGVARRIGFENSTGRYLLFVDSDDVLYSNDVLSHFHKLISNNDPFDLLFFNVNVKFKNHTKLMNALNSKVSSDGLYDIDQIKNINVRSALWYKLFARDKMKKAFFTDAKNLEDCYTTYHYLNECKNFYFCNKICYVANRDVGDSLSKQDQLKKINESVDTLKATYAITKYKKALFFTIADYYTAMRRLIDKSSLSKNEKTRLILKVLELKKIIKSHRPLLLKANIKVQLKYMYYSIGDFRYEK